MREKITAPNTHNIPDRTLNEYCQTVPVLLFNTVLCVYSTSKYKYSKYKY